jgi:cytochrome c5
MEQTTYTVSRHPMPGSRQSILLAPALILLTGLSSATVTLRTGAAENAQNAVDHAGMIRSWDQAAYGRGRALYNSICLTCHGNLTQQGTLPTSRAFWKEPFKNGTDPYRIYQTLSQGYGQMPAWTFMTPRQRYDVIHYVRETFLRPHNPSAYFKVDSDYLGDLPKAGSKPFKKTPEMIAFEKGPKYRRMDFGPALFWTFQVAPRNIAYKGIAIRLDDGPGGVSKGRAWMVYDHDTMRVAAAWTGEKFVNWKGIAFDGSHGTHTSIVGDKLFVNPVGPGWADPQTGDFADPRFLGRDKKPYGPLPRTWTHFKGVYLHSNRVVIAYTVGDANILEQPRLLQHRGRAVFSRNLDVGESSHDLLMRIAPTNVSAAIVGASQARVTQRDGHNLLHIPKTATPLQLVAASQFGDCRLSPCSKRWTAAMEPSFSHSRSDRQRGRPVRGGHCNPTEAYGDALAFLDALWRV